MAEQSDHHKTCKVVNAETRKEINDALVRAPSSIEGIYFTPWVGKSYGRDGFFGGKRILILGASHYEWCKRCRTDGIKRGRDLTCRCVAELVVPGEDSGIQHWRNIEYALNEQRLDDGQRAAFWHSVAYANYVQELVGFFAGGGRPSPPTRKMLEAAEQPFLCEIAALQPDLVIVLGYTLWTWLPEENGCLPKLEAGGKVLERCIYLVESMGGRKTITAARVRHPAAGLGAPWYPVLAKALAGC